MYAVARKGAHRNAAGVNVQSFGGETALYGRRLAADTIMAVIPGILLGIVVGVVLGLRSSSRPKP